MTLDAIETLLSRQIGLDVASVGRRALDAAITARMTALGVREPDAYLALVTTRADQLAALIEEVVVPETWFLRDRTPFTHLASHARVAWRNGGLRLLSAPCSTGEEPYSIAIALLDAGFAPGELAIDAIDVSERALAVARRAIYGATSFRGEPGDLRERHFDPAGDGWTPRAVVRERVRFVRANLLDAGWFEPGLRYHAIFCRNLLIYLTAEARARVVQRLLPMLEPGGLVVVGHAEALQVMDPRFRAVEAAGSFTFTRVEETAKKPARTPTLPGVPAARTTPRRVKPLQPVAAVPAPAPVPVPVRDRLAEAAVLADRGDLAGAAALCTEHLRERSDDAAGHALLGTIHQAGGSLVDAEASFTRAIYCDPGHSTALLQLALLREGRGDADGAAQLRRRAARARGGAK